MKTPILAIDFETRSTVEITTTGAYPYAVHPSTELWCLAWAIDDAEPQLWLPSEPIPQAIVDHIEYGYEVRAWNVGFERLMWREIMVPRYGAPKILDEQWQDTAAEAAAMGLPRKLADCAAALKVPMQKDDAGYRLMLRLCRPRGYDKEGRPLWWEPAADPERFQRLYDYCKQDVRSERAVKHAIRRLTPTELEYFRLDMRINDRGMALDIPFIQAAQRIVTEGTLRANEALSNLTGGAVSSVTKRTDLVAWMRSGGVEVDSIAKAAVEKLLAGELPEEVRMALQLRADVGRSSVAKLAKMLKCLCPDERVRGLLMYHAAATGRWGGKLIQPQNFPRGEIDDAERFIPMILNGEFDLIDLLAPPIVVVLSLLRGMLVPAAGKVFVAGDYATIEARVLNWLAGQRDVIDLFRAMDAGDASKHPYKMMAVHMGRAKTPADVKKGSIAYQAGKAAELGCGFQMGWKKFVKAAWDVYRVTVNDEEARSAVKAYRASHPKVQGFWQEANDALIQAVQNPNTKVPFGDQGRLKAVCAGAWLYIILPSGRPLCYAAPRVVMAEMPWSKENREDWKAARAMYDQFIMDLRREGIPPDAEILAMEPGPEPMPEFREQIEYSGVDSMTKRWVRMRLYGGLIVENVVQAVARDIMAHGMLNCEKQGFGTPVLTVHDEVVCEIGGVDNIAEGRDKARELEAVLCQTPEWATGLPTAAEAWCGPRYRK